MKKKVLFIFGLLLCLCFASACSTSQAKDYTDEYKAIFAAHKELTKSLNRNVVEKVDLPTTVEGTNITVSWESKNASLMDNTGAVLSRPSEVTKVEFDYTLTNGEVSKTYTLAFNVSSMTLEQAEAELKAALPEEVEENVEIPNCFANGTIQAIVTSNNPDYLDENGVFTNPPTDKAIVLSYVITDGNKEVKGTINVTAKAKERDVRFAETETWLRNVSVNDCYFTANTKLPTEYEATGAKINWSCKTDGILNDDNTVKQYVYERYATLTAAVLIEGEYERYKFYVSIEPLDTTNMTKAEIVENFVSAIAVPSVDRMIFNQAGYLANTQFELYKYYNLDASWGYIPFYTGTSSKNITVEQIAPLDSTSGHDNRPGIKKTSTEYVCVHDTADTGSGASQMANYVGNGGGGTSWHYTVDSTSIYHQIPDDEIAYHAGDGTRIFSLIDTGIKATSKKPHIEFDAEGYYTINGVSTKVRPLTGSNSEQNYPEDPNIYTTDQIGSTGITCEIGENGNYFLGRTYYNSTYKLIGNYGGNRNSIGMETCVTYGKDYALTVRNIANLCSDLCIENGLSVDRVVTHHYFSGKPCPNALLVADEWHDLHDEISALVFGKTQMAGYKFEWTALSSNINAVGSIALKSKVGDVVKYSVVVSDASGSKLYEDSFSTKLR